MTKRVITKLPDACSFKTGERIKCNSRIYEKKKSGRWATVITKKLLEEVYKVYCLEGCNLTQTKNKLNLPGLPTVPVQKILEENNWFRSHYKRGKRYREYLRINKSKILKAVYKYHVPKQLILAHVGIPRNSSIEGILGVILPKNGRGHFRIELMTDLEADVNKLSFSAYKNLVRFVSYNMVKIFGKSFALIKPCKKVQLDYKFSIFNGYYTLNSTVKNKIKRDKVIPIKYMAHPYNLQYLTPYENNSKSIKNSISGRELQKMVDKCKVQVSSIKSYYQDVFNLLGLEENGANRI